MQPIESGSTVGEGRSLLERFAPVLLLMRAVGLYHGQPVRPTTNAACRAKAIGFCASSVYSMLTLCGWLYLSRQTIHLCMYLGRMYGVLHAMFMASVITGTKPIVNSAMTLVFWCKARQHHKFLSTLNELDQYFQTEYQPVMSITRFNARLVCLALSVPLLMLGLRVYEICIMDDETLWESWPTTLLVLVLTLVNITPALYFAHCNHMVRFYCGLVAEGQLRSCCPLVAAGTPIPLEYYYRQFLKVTELVKSLQRLFEPFIILTLLWTVTTMCLAIYFVTQAKEIFPPMPDVFRDFMSEEDWQQTAYFQAVYASMQVLIAAVVCWVVCAQACKTNEASRNITARLFGENLAGDSSDQYYLSCFLSKLNTQTYWGVTIARTFSIERPVFFTLISVILTYAILLLKFRDHQQHALSTTAQPSTVASVLADL